MDIELTQKEKRRENYYKQKKNIVYNKYELSKKDINGVFVHVKYFSTLFLAAEYLNISYNLTNRIYNGLSKKYKNDIKIIKL